MTFHAETPGRGRGQPSRLRPATWLAARLCAAAIFVLLSVFCPAPARAAEDFGDISVSPNAIYTGNTFHGYAEMRVVLENRSPSRSHVVTLVFPNRSYSSGGNFISRLSRTVSLAPEAREVVSLLQPPLPARGDGAIRVEVDGREEGSVRAPNSGNHCTYYTAGGQIGTVFVSRSLDFDAVSRVFQANSFGFTPAKATGPPDATSSGFNPNCWMPDMRSYGRSNWIELDYSSPQPVTEIRVYSPRPPVTSGTLTLVGISGTNLAAMPVTSGTVTSSGSSWTYTFSITAATQPVKTVRLDFGKLPPSNVSVDAVSIAGPAGTQWAADARASSDNSAAAPRYRSGSTGSDDVQSLRAESPVSEWSENWLAYSPFDAVVASQADFNGMSPAVVAAIGAYVHAGGNLVLLGQGSLPAVWHSLQTRKLPGGQEFDLGFGSVFAFANDGPAALNASAVQQLREMVRETVRYFQNLPNDGNTANAILPVVKNLRIPTRGIVLVMLAFVVVIGPVNLIYLSRIKRRTWMLWTIPAISFATTLLVFAYSLLREGITPDTRIAGITVLDQTSHLAATIGAEAFYCPLTPSGGLNFDFGTEATPLVALEYGSGSAREVDWSQSQHFQRGWVESRVPEHFHMRKAETRRERIQVLNENGKLEIVNSLGASIKTIWVADSSGRVYLGSSVAAGEKGGLLVSRLSASAGKSAAYALLRDLTFAAHTDTLGENAGQYLLPNTYLAVLDGNPFLENALGAASSPMRTKSSCVVFGMLDAGETHALVSRH